MKIEYGAYLPTALLENLSDLMDYHFLEPCTHGGYIGFYHDNNDKIKILDNGLIEFRQAWNVGNLLEYAKQVNPNVLVAPDQLGNWQFNRDNFEITRRDFNCGTVGIVLAGPNWQEQEKEVHDLLGWDGANIFLPYRLNRQPIEASWIHLLGFKHPEYYTPYKAKTRVHLSIDTVEPISAAYHKWSYADKRFASFPRPDLYNQLRPEGGLERERISLDLCRENIAWFKEWLNSRP